MENKKEEQIIQKEEKEEIRSKEGVKKTGKEDKTQKVPSLDNISNEIFDLLGEANDNLQDKEIKVVNLDEKLNPFEENSENNANLDYMEVMKQVEEMLPENNRSIKKGENDDIYFNFVSSKSFDLKKESDYQNNK